MKSQILKAKWCFAILLAAAATVFLPISIVGQPKDPELWRQVEIIRTTYGVPHIRAANLRAAGYALAWLQCEDYGPQTAMNVLRASGRAASVLGRERLESDLNIRRYRERNYGKYSSISKDARDIYDGFAAGINRFVRLHPAEFPAGMPTDFKGLDVAALEIATPSPNKVRDFITKITPVGTSAQLTEVSSIDPPELPHADEGSNAWAFAPSRTKSGKAILLRNPHLQWTAGYYEAHVTVPGLLDFYGDFRIGGPFAVIGGFNKYLGWSTTNNSQDLDQIYSLDADPKSADHYLLDGRSHPLIRESVTAEFRTAEGISSETREFWSTPFGPVIHRADGKIYIFKFAGDGEVHAGEQFMRMMRARTLGQWKSAMKMRARPTSNFTYADRDGNIFLIWNAALPLLPHAPVNETTAIHVSKTTDMWSRYVPFESLPQFLNPAGGYVHNENSSPHYTNIRTPVDTKNKYPNFEEPELSLRSQLALQLIGGSDKFSLEDVVHLKNNYRMLLPDRVKADLIAAVKASNPTDDAAAAIDVLEKWDNTASPTSRGSALFETWWLHYSGQRPPERMGLLPDNRRFAKVWTPEDPYQTPRGLADTKRAVESFTWAVAETKRRYGAVDVAWGDIHRVRRGSVDVPVGGCSNELGCFRVLGFARQDDGKLAASVGDGWVLAVEFGATPRAYSVLSYGQSRLPSSPYYANQAEMFAKGEMKKVAFTRTDVDAQAIVKYRPGEKAAR